MHAWRFHFPCMRGSVERGSAAGYSEAEANTETWIRHSGDHSMFAQYFGVCRTNSYAPDPDEWGTRRHQLFPTVSRVNHSCLPTCILDIKGDEAVSVCHVCVQCHTPRAGCLSPNGRGCAQALQAG